MNVRPSHLNRSADAPFTKIRRGAAALLAIVMFAVLGFRYLAHYDWIESLWMVVITISTVGYGEHSTLSTASQLLSIMVILLGTTAGAYTFTGLIQLTLQGELDRAFGLRRMEREISRLKNHTIICGFGKSGPILAEDLSRSNCGFVILEIDHTNYQQAIEMGYLAINADATDEEALKEANITEAGAIVVALPSDAENVFITLSARNLCPSIRIVALADQESTSRKLRQAGANEVVLGHQMVAEYLSRLVTRPIAAQFFSSLTQPEFQDLMLDELAIPDGSDLDRRSIAELRIRDKHQLLVVAVKTKEDTLDFNPSGDRVFQSGETVLVMGKLKDVHRFQQSHNLIETIS
ncbi:potassium channel family protein [Roseiconus lacunae]|uniref:Potassium channel protein n=1 Tax=Roseiconus lacunae TaxID=2605694 RepID=A0ABT7PNK2_9BACT|nr:potassium channel protein [Roseiconus lacunae]MCD0462652.1 potassium channel protein [Roseiconus lacunae]MDM4017854.1 potassium channel protein [Roseiconus lacunae]WRQ52570.1 potassium channel protein [Stieleria sp. HD01]